MNKFNFPWYTKQKDAIDHALAHAGFRVFVRETFSTLAGRDSTRSFISADKNKFLLSYFDVEDEMKHFYELILVDHPCRLYFDLEFDRSLNIGLDDDEVVDCFISVMSHCVNIEFNANCKPDCVLDLESSVDLLSPPSTKMSHHLVFHLPQHIFGSNKGN